MAETAPKVQTNSRGPRQSSGRRDAPAEPKEFQELVINIDRVARVVKGGRRFRFKALVVVGNDKNKVGIGVAKGADVQAAIAKATDVAKKHILTIAIEKDTIPHDCELQFSGARVMMKPASAGTGIIAGGVVRSIIGVTGIRDILTKSLGSTNKVNIAYATIEALRSLVPKSEWLHAPSQKLAVKKPAEKMATTEEKTNDKV
ncbi:MAG TPA: 30S ribosomal protein S5 [Candidatus Saccharimonadales bacterium]|nr:30S ribosomal protein S5 [Candidatus Saccharimonadales bacterium]